MTRKYKLSQMFHAKDIAGTMMILPVFSDLDNDELQEQFEFYLERENFEYLEQLVGEATFRGIKFKVKSNKSKNDN